MSLRRVESLAYAAIGSIVIAASCAKAEDSPLADQGGDDDGGDNGTGGTVSTGGTSGSTTTGGTAGKGGSTTGGSAGKGGTTSTGGKGGTTSTGGEGGASTPGGCLDDSVGGEGGQGGASGGAPGEAGAGGGGNGALFFDDFEDGNADGWIPTSGSWRVGADGSRVYHQTDATKTNQYISAVEGSSWTDQIVEARVKIVAFNGNSTSNAAGLFARYVDAETHYLVGMNSGNNGELFIARRINSTSNSPERIIQKTNMRWEECRWYTLRLEVVGSSLRAYLDGNLELEETDTGITSGGVAVGARHVNVRFDDVRVTEP